MARLKAILTYEYDANPSTYGEGHDLTPESMAAIDQAQFALNPEIVLSQEDLRVRVKVVAE